MQERIIENWLINATEREGFQWPFCQLLIQKGYRILRVSSHGQMEEGKDIIAFDTRGKPCAFQLKTGNINRALYRQIKGEIDDLIEIPIRHPSGKEDNSFKAFLVTTGSFSEPLVHSIAAQNRTRKKKGLPCLEIWQGTELLSDFNNIHGIFLPNKLNDYDAFLKIYSANGRENLDKEKFSAFLYSLFFFSYPKMSKNKFKQLISSGILLCHYALRPYFNAKNHVAILEGLSILCAFIYALASKHKLSLKIWGCSVELVYEEIAERASAFKKEVLARKNFFEGALLGDGDLVYKTRVTMVLGWLAALELFCKRRNNNYCYDDLIGRLICDNYPQNLFLWGESSVPYHLMIILFMKANGDVDFARDVASKVLSDIVEANCRDNSLGMPDPYYLPDEFLRHVFHSHEHRIEFAPFTGSSYCMKSLIELLARFNDRATLEDLWKKISDIQSCEFVPRPIWHSYFWRCDNGDDVQFFYDRPQSWAKIKTKAFLKPKKVPVLLSNNPSFVLLFLLTYPHRFRSDLIKLIDDSFVESEVKKQQ